MRKLSLLWLPLIVTACVATRYAAQEQGAATETARSGASEHQAAAGALDSRMPLSLWNAGERHSEIRLVDLATGQEAPDYPPIVAGSPFAYSADGRKLAVHEPGRWLSCEKHATACRAGAGVLYLVDLHVWRDVTVPLPAKGWIGSIGFSPDASHLALVANEQQSSTLLVVDTISGTIVAQRALEPGFRPSRLVYREDGATLAVYGQPLGADPGVSKPDPPRALLLDATTFEVQWDQALPDVLSGHWCLEIRPPKVQGAPADCLLSASWEPAVVPPSDGRRLYVVHPDSDRLTTVDLEARAVRTAEIRAERSWIEQMLGLVVGVAEAKAPIKGAFKSAVLSPDGARLYVVGRTIDSKRDPREVWQITEASLGLQVIDVQTGRKISGRDIGGTGSIGISLTPDGARVLLRGWEGGAPWTDVLDAQSLQRVAHLAGWEVVATRRVDGRQIILASQRARQATQLALLDAQSFEIVRSWSVNTDASWVTTP